jgi:hypothetical protein
VPFKRKKKKIPDLSLPPCNFSARSEFFLGWAKKLFRFKKGSQYNNGLRNYLSQNLEKIVFAKSRQISNDVPVNPRKFNK